MQIVRGSGIASESDIDGAFAQSVDQLAGVKFVEMQLHSGVEAAVTVQDRGQTGKHRGADEADSQHANFAAGYAADGFQVLGDLAQSAAGAVHKGFTGGGQFDGTGRAEE
jgi:hypothetical protein